MSSFPSVKMSSLLTDFAENVLENLQHNVSINREVPLRGRGACEDVDWRSTSSKETLTILLN